MQIYQTQLLIDTNYIKPTIHVLCSITYIWIL